MAGTDIQLKIELEEFYQGFSPTAHIDNKTLLGNKGHASEMQADIISNPSYIQQSPALADLTNGNQSGVIDQLIRFILDRPTDTDITYAVGTTKLFKLSSTTAVSGGSPSWPQAITDMTEGESVIRLKENLFVFYNKSSGGDIAAMPLSSEVIDPDWGSATDQALEKAKHPAAAKEDILIFGNGRYVGTYIAGINTLDVQKLDFGEGSEVVDIVYHSGVWWIAVNYGEGRRGQIYLYDGAAISNVLADEVGVGTQEIGFLYVHNATVYVAYTDKTASSHAVGFVSGRTIKPLRYFAGTLPDHRQKTLYLNTILFPSNEDIYSCGARVEQLPIQISNLLDGGHANIGGIAAPFGAPMIASSDGSTDHRIAKLNGYSTDSTWKSVFIDMTEKTMLGLITTIIVHTKPLHVDASCKIKLEGNQGEKVSSFYTVSGEDKTMHIIRSVDLKSIEDVRVVIDYSDGDAAVTCPIRKIVLLGNYIEN